MPTKSKKKSSSSGNNACTGLTKEELYACMLMVANPKRLAGGKIKCPREAQNMGNAHGQSARMTKSRMVEGIKENLRDWPARQAFV